MNNLDEGMDEPEFDSKPPATDPDGPVDGWTPPSAIPRSGLERIALLTVAVVLIVLVVAFVGGCVYGFLVG